MVQTRKSLGTSSTDRNASQQKRRSLEIPFQRVYSVLTETTSYATTIHTSELQDEEDVYETENDSSFASSQASDTTMSLENNLLKYGAIIIGLIVVAIVVGMMMKSSPIKTDAPYENYIKAVRSTLNNNFPTVTKENRDLLRLIGQKVFLEPDNHAPLVVLVGGTKSKEFAEAINQAIQDAKNEEEKTKKLSIRVESDTNRAELHENLRGALGTSLTSQTSPRSAIVMDVDLLKWDAVLVLHAFSDHENYPVPKAILFLTVSEKDETVSSVSGESCDERMVRFLTIRWIENGGSSDNIPPIIARISYFLCV